MTQIYLYVNLLINWLNKLIEIIGCNVIFRGRLEEERSRYINKNKKLQGFIERVDLLHENGVHHNSIAIWAQHKVVFKCCLASCLDHILLRSPHILDSAFSAPCFDIEIMAEEHKQIRWVQRFPTGNSTIEIRHERMTGADTISSISLKNWRKNVL